MKYHAINDSTVFQMRDELIAKYHPHLAEANLILFWAYGVKPDQDDRLMLGKCKKASEFDKALETFDFAIILNFAAWTTFDERQQWALLDHELCHAARVIDKKGEEAEDDEGNPKWRIRKHDLEEFRDVVARHGCWMSDLEEFAKALNADTPSLFDGVGDQKEAS